MMICKRHYWHQPIDSKSFDENADISNFVKYHLFNILRYNHWVFTEKANISNFGKWQLYSKFSKSLGKWEGGRVCSWLMLAWNSRYPRNVGIFVAGRDGSSEAFYPGFLSVGAIQQGRRIPGWLLQKNKWKETIMMTLRQFSAEPSTIPAITSWYLADLSKAQGKQELFPHQSPQKLKILR